MEKAGLLNKPKNYFSGRAGKNIVPLASSYSPFHSVTFTLLTIDIAQFANTDHGLVPWCPAMQITYELDLQGEQSTVA
jgi:hypothetical protein